MAAVHYSRASELLEAELGDELVALDEARGLCFGFSNVATDVWRLLARPASLDQLIGKLRDQYEVEEAQCRDEVQALLDEMLREGLIRAETV